MKQKRIKKTPADYPQLQFKVSQEEKDEIMERIKVLVNYFNEHRDESELMYRNNDIAKMALERGLTYLEQRLK